MTVEGAIDTSNSVSFQGQVMDLVKAAPGIRAVRMDCAGLNYMSSMGVGIILEILKTLKRSNIELVIANMPKHIYDIINLLGYCSFLNFE
jgi:anti-anti-sigma factor